MKQHHMYPQPTNVAPPSRGRHAHGAATADVESLSEGDDLPGDLLTWCHLLHWMPSGWGVTPPFRPELGGQWTVVANKTRRSDHSDLPSVLICRGDEPADAVFALANHFVEWSAGPELAAMIRSNH